MASRNTLPEIEGGVGVLGDAIGRSATSSEPAESASHGTMKVRDRSEVAGASNQRCRPNARVGAPLKTKVPFNLPRELAEELRDAVFALSGPPHCMSLAGLAELALRTELARLREAENGGSPFEARSGRLKPGRRVE